jgi:phosphoglucosamine mutase
MTAKGKMFGTDGVRGVANHDLTATLALHLGRALGFYLLEGATSPLILLGKDPRLSSDMIEQAFSAGVLSSGVRVGLLGIVTTPALSILVKEYRAQAGVMISASHNPIDDNGIKIFGPDGRKLQDDQEVRIEQIHDTLSWEGPRFPASYEFLEEGAERYRNFLRRFAPSGLPPLRLVLDCAWGSTSLFAPGIFTGLGLQVEALNAVPDGQRINVHSGATRPEVLRQAVLSRKADLGFTFDGDGDRLMAVDRTGRLVDGDVVLCAYGLHSLRQGTLPGAVVVGTVMSNLGLEMALAKEGGHLQRAKVGDRYVLERMAETGAAIGGEQSGHIIFGEVSPAGDGILTALMLLNLMVGSGKDLSELGVEMVRVPQVLLNVHAERKEFLDQDRFVQDAIRDAELRLEGRGRVLVRSSGTEKLVRVMVEAPDSTEAQQIAQDLASLIEDRLAG